jgi:hypothetical protein
LVSQARPESFKPQAAESAGTTADAENQTPMPRSSARASRPIVRHLPVNA